MHARRLVIAALSAAALLALPASALAVVDEVVGVETPNGRISVEVRRPDGAAKVPIILTYSPYNTLAEQPGGTVAADSLAATFVPKGYARAVADVIGTRNSTGCWDYGGPKEQQSGVDLVNALAKLPWSNGKVAMIGGSYDGTTANMVAVRGEDVPGLAAIVPQAAISRWYGYAYQDGARYLGNSSEPTDEGVDTPFAFDFGLTRTPPTKPDAASLLDLPTGRYALCDSVAHTQHGYDTTPDYDAFWRERDYLKDAARVRVPALVTHGWQDYNVKQSEGLDFYTALTNAPFKLLYMWQGPHGVPGGPYNALLAEFFDRTLKGADNGIDREPPVRTFGRTGETADRLAHEEDAWPPPGTREIALGLGAGTQSFTDTGTSSEEAALAAGPAAQQGWRYYEWPALDAPLRIAGSPVLDATLTDSQDTGQLSPTLLDVAPDGTAVAISRGHLNLQYRGGLAQAVPVPVGEAFGAHVRLAPQDQTIPAGHHLGLIVAGSNVVWAVPDRPGSTFALDAARSSLRLPVVP
ncbi:MAG: Xaa-Pro dipeptidyl-peptidase [Solirubrobacterales bacterium]|nr:Xaa-Pro dipeptidyl-peptidase [Solirubrobacterales bacterium]